jgi:hypothetical protein
MKSTGPWPLYQRSPRAARRQDGEDSASVAGIQCDRDAGHVRDGNCSSSEDGPPVTDQHRAGWCGKVPNFVVFASASAERRVNKAIPASEGIDLQQDPRLSPASPRHDMQGSHENARPDLKARTDGPPEGVQTRPR